MRVLMLLVVLLWASPVLATVDWEEGFEYTDNTAMSIVWPASCLGNPGVSTTRPHSGSKSLKEIFRGEAGVDPGAGGCFMDRAHPSSETLYTRFYMYMENFTVNSVGTKVVAMGPNGLYPSFWWVLPFGSASLSVTVQGIILDNGSQDSVNVFGGAIPQNQWVCLETRLTMSAPGVDNGIIQEWINGTQTINKTNQRMRAATLNQLNSPTAQFQSIRLYTQHGLGTIYYDDFAVSRDARIGCTGPPPDIIAPAAPTGLQIQ